MTDSRESGPLVLLLIAFLHVVDASSASRCGTCRLVRTHVGSAMLTRVGRGLKLDGRVMDLEATTDHILGLGQDPVVVSHRKMLHRDGADWCQLQMHSHGRLIACTTEHEHEQE